MGTSTFAALAGMGLFAMLIMIVVGIALGALILSVSFRLVVGFMPSYLRALGAVVLTYVGAFAAMLILGMVVHSSVLSLIVTFLVGAVVVNYLLRAADGSEIGFGKACVVELINMVAGMVLGFLVVLIFGAAILAH
ncbi:hypothetical protein ACFCQI_04565 [Rhodanobacter sp. FW102-FHT14D06]|uniref:DUF350 domain-containing protein n=2 Tax=unclassified Rhodanobacter TaxID=2621553 RepID=A0AB74UWA2_9GAMM